MKKKPMRGTGGPKRQDLPDDPEQSKRFEDKARELGVDESGKEFEKAMETLSQQSPLRKSK